uniref:Uncharacterized protein n=1 Tax=Rhizophora mucronata TaxID=61149 RepID=A0A2P2N4Q4_RHIMU
MQQNINMLNVFVIRQAPEAPIRQFPCEIICKQGNVQKYNVNTHSLGKKHPNKFSCWIRERKVHMIADKYLLQRYSIEI